MAASLTHGMPLSFILAALYTNRVAACISVARWALWCCMAWIQRPPAVIIVCLWHFSDWTLYITYLEICNWLTKCHSLMNIRQHALQTAFSKSYHLWVNISIIKPYSFIPPYPYSPELRFQFGQCWEIQWHTCNLCRPHQLHSLLEPEGRGQKHINKASKEWNR